MRVWPHRLPCFVGQPVKQKELTVFQGGRMLPFATTNETNQALEYRILSAHLAGRVISRTTWLDVNDSAAITFGITISGG